MKTASDEFIAQEEAVQREPSEIYHIWDEFDDWYLTDGDTAVTVSGIEYSASTITRSDIPFNAELEPTEVKITGIYLDDPLVQFIVLNPLRTLWINISKIHRDQSPIEASVIFIGHIMTVTFKGNAAEATAVSFDHYLSQGIPKYRYSPTCNNFLFDDYCSLDKDTYKDTGTVTAVSTDGLTITVSDISATAGYFTSGYLEAGDHRITMIAAHEGSTLTLRYKVATMVSGTTVDCYPGCDLGIETCRDKYNNVPNFFGHPYIPLNNPALRV